jgi:hypothetical protein
MNASQQTVASVLHADRQYINAAQDRIEELEAENSRLRARAAYYEKQYREFVPANPVAWVDHDNVVTDEGVYHVTLAKFIEDNIEAFDEVLAKAHTSWVEYEAGEALIAARGDY